MTPLLLLCTALGALAHGDHSFDLADQTDSALSYAERHMHTEHHIDSFDLESFFKLHDLDMNGCWDELEIQAVYGLHHHSLKDKLGRGHADGRAQNIVAQVLEALDKDQDDHYDEESEYFLHHEELYHSTPETQTEESYTHPEDHAEIEDEEDARERTFEGLPPTADLSKDHVAADPLDHHEHAPGQGPLGENENENGNETPQPGDEIDPPSPARGVPKRVDPGAAPQRIIKPGHLDEELGGLKEAALEEPGWYGGARPKSAEQRLRAGVPYKYKMRKGFRYDEF
ncbi:hypothetical protein LQV05_001831 [Cryptococcus neoformans]|nr:hypothetical protein LQV05_001831 [Cryptococcus neoformans]